MEQNFYEYIGAIRKIPHDVTIKCRDGKLTASKMLLSIRNDYFDKMFNGSFKEISTTEISIDEDVIIVELLLNNIQYNERYKFSYYDEDGVKYFDKTCGCSDSSECAKCKVFWKFYKDDALKEIPILIKYLVLCDHYLIPINTELIKLLKRWVEQHFYLSIKIYKLTLLYPFLEEINKSAASKIYKGINKLKCKAECDCGVILNDEDCSILESLKSCNYTCVDYQLQDHSDPYYEIEDTNTTWVAACNNSHFNHIKTLSHQHDDSINIMLRYTRRDLSELTDEDILCIVLDRKL